MEQLIRTIDEIGKHVRRTEPLDRDMFYEMHYPKWKAETSHTSDIGNITVEAFRTMREQMRKRCEEDRRGGEF